MNKEKLAEWIRKLIRDKNIDSFYNSRRWRNLRLEVLDEQKGKCQECDKKGKVTDATTVHHVQFVTKHPELALSKYYTYNGKQYRNLVAVCNECHNKLHPEKLNKKTINKFSNKELW